MNLEWLISTLRTRSIRHPSTHPLLPGQHVLSEPCCYRCCRLPGTWGAVGAAAPLPEGDACGPPIGRVCVGVVVVISNFWRLPGKCTGSAGWVCRVGEHNLLTSCCLSCVLPQPRSSRNAARPSSPVPAASTASSAASGVTGSRTAPTAATKRTAVSGPVFTPAAPLLRAGHSQRWLPPPQAPAFSAEPDSVLYRFRLVSVLSCHSSGLS